jgi:hypothetical protein
MPQVRPAALPATVPLDHAHWKLNAGPADGADDTREPKDEPDPGLSRIEETDDNT